MACCAVGFGFGVVMDSDEAVIGHGLGICSKQTLQIARCCPSRHSECHETTVSVQ